MSEYEPPKMPIELFDAILAIKAINLILTSKQSQKSVNNSESPSTEPIYSLTDEIIVLLNLQKAPV